MNKNLIYLTIVVSALTLSFVESSFAFRTLYDLGAFEAEENSRTDEGVLYEQKFEQLIQKKYSHSMQNCFNNIEIPDAKHFSIVLMLTEKGGVEEIEYRPKTNIAVCLGEALKKDILPLPPRDNYWVELEMAITE